MTGDGGERQGAFVCSDGHEEPWRTRRSSRARHVRVTMSAQEGLVVVLPACSTLDPAACLERAREEVERMVARVRPAREAFLAELAAPLPAVLELPGIGERWAVEYSPSPARLVSGRAQWHGIARHGASSPASDTCGVLVVSGDTHDRVACARSLAAFVTRRAKEELPVRLSRIAQRAGVHVEGCRVRVARTRWGSCSSQGRVMLSVSLVFLPPELVDHVICHELAHLDHLDHSSAFHERLEQLDPRSREHARALRDGVARVPAWMSLRKADPGD